MAITEHDVDIAIQVARAPQRDLLNQCEVGKIVLSFLNGLRDSARTGWLEDWILRLVIARVQGWQKSNGCG